MRIYPNIFGANIIPQPPTSILSINTTAFFFVILLGPAVLGRAQSMKKRGCTFEYERERDDDLLRVYRDAIHAARHIHMPDILNAVVNSASRRFWVSEERAAIVIGQLLRGESIPHMRTLKREMFDEILRRVLLLRSQYPDMTISMLVFHVVRQQAPKFYLTPGSAKVILSRIRKKRRNEYRRHNSRE